MINIWFNLYPISTEIYLILSVCLLLIYGVFLANFINIGFPILTQNLGWLALQITIFGFVLTYSQHFIFLVSWNNFLINDYFSWGVKLIILFSSISWILLSFTYVSNEKLNSFEYWILILLAISAMLFVTQAFDLLSMYLAIEFQSLVFYILASFKRNSEFSTEAGLKYFVLGAFSSALLLFGSSILYGLTGLTNLNDFSKLFSGILIEENSFFVGILLGFTFIVVALLFKLSSAPFHMWSPDVYEGSPTSVTAFFSVLPKLAILTLIFRFLLFSFHDFIPFWRNFILICAVLSFIVGSLGAFSQTKWKRFFAYSSITHIGFVLISLLTGDLESIVNIILYIVIYILTMLGIFSFVLGLRFFKYPYHHQTRYLKELTFLSKSNPSLALALALLLFSMAGIPPLAGFFAKFFVLLTALQTYSVGLSLFAVLASCVACFYYIKLIKAMYFVNSIDWVITYPVSKQASIVLGFSVFSILFIFLDLESIRTSIFLMSSIF